MIFSPKANFVKPTFVRIIANTGELPPETGRMTTINATVIALLAPMEPIVKKTLAPRWAAKMEAVVSSSMPERFATAASSTQVWYSYYTNKLGTGWFIVKSHTLKADFKNHLWVDFFNTDYYAY